MNTLVFSSQLVSQAQNKLKLNLGCSSVHKDGYLNIDIQEPCDLKHDLTKPLPFEDNSIDEIYSKDVIQLFTKRQWGFLKTQMVRVLKPGGKMELFCDDFEYVIENFLSCKDENAKWGYWIRCIFSGQGNKYDYFKNAFTYRKLVYDLEEEGMERFKRLWEPEYEGWIHLICYKK